MNPKSLTDVCVISDNPFFISRIKIFSQNSKIKFEYSNNTACMSLPRLFLIDIEKLEKFLKAQSNLTTIKFIIHGEQRDLAISFKAGCTDFLKEPWNSDELEARLSKAINFNNMQFYWNKLKISQKSISSGKNYVNISIEEYIILKKLIENKKEAVPREALLNALWGKQKGGSRVIDMHISNLRKKIRILKNSDESCCASIKTIRSYGYMII